MPRRSPKLKVTAVGRPDPRLLGGVAQLIFEYVNSPAGQQLLEKSRKNLKKKK